MLASLVLLTGGCASRPVGSAAANPATVAPALVDPAKRAEAYYAFSLAQQAIEQGDAGSALQLVAHAIELDPGSPYLYTFRAGLELSRRDVAAGTRSLQEALRVNPFYPAALYMYGGLMVALGRVDEAIASYERALAADSGSLDVYLYLVDLYLQKQDLGRARAMATRMVEQFPAMAQGYYYRAKVHLLEGKTADALDQLQAALERDPQNEEVLFALGSLLEKEGRAAEATELYRKQLDQMPDNLRLRDHLVSLYLQAEDWDRAEQENAELASLGYDPATVERNRGVIAMGRQNYQDAIRAFEQALVAEPGDDRSRYSIGMAQLRLRRYDEALDAFGRIEPASELYPDGRFGVGYTYREMGRAQDALGELETAIEQAPDRDEFRRLHALTLADLGRFDDAEKELRELIDRNSDDLSYRFSLGAVYEKARRFDDGVKLMKDVLKRDPDNSDAHNYIGYTYADQGVRLDEAEADLNKAIAKKPGDPFISDSLGWLYYRQGRTREALAKLLEAAGKVPDEPVILQHLGVVYQALGERDKARQSLEKALSLAKDPKLHEEIAGQIRALQP